MNSRVLRSIASKHSDSDLLSNLDIDELLKAAESEPNLEGKTLDSIQSEIYDTLVGRVPLSQIQTMFHKLAGYQLVDEIYKLHRGKHVRWIPLEKSDTLTLGGVVLNIKFADTGPLVLCRTGQRFVQYRFNECITFQKLSEDELLILAAYNAISESAST